HTIEMRVLREMPQDLRIRLNAHFKMTEAFEKPTIAEVRGEVAALALPLLRRERFSFDRWCRWQQLSAQAERGAASFLLAARNHLQEVRAKFFVLIPVENQSAVIEARQNSFCRIARAAGRGGGRFNHEWLQYGLRQTLDKGQRKHQQPRVSD